MDDKDFTRKRSLSILVVIMLIINLVKEKNLKGYDITMNTFWSECKKNNIELKSEVPPTRSAFCQARKKIKAKVFKMLLRKSAEEFDKLYGKNHRWKYMRVFAVDGSKYTLPASEELIKKYGCQNCGEVEAHYPQAQVNVLFNVRSKVAYDIVIDENKGDERKNLLKLCNLLREKDLVILDRGYPSYEVISFLLKRKINYIIRSPLSNTFKNVELFLKEETDDKIVEFEDSKNKKKYKLRLIKSRNEKGENRVFITSLLNKEVYKYDEIVDLYYERWEIEEHYKSNKELFKVENFHARDENGILQEIYSQILLSNLARFAMNEAEKDNIEKKDEPSFKNAVDVLERYFNGIILTESKENQEIQYSNLLEEIRRVRYKKIKGRSYQRKSFKVITKWTRKKCLT